MHASRLLIPLIAASATLAWWQASPAQQRTLWGWILGPRPAATVAEPVQAIDRKRVVVASAPAAARPSAATMARTPTPRTPRPPHGEQVQSGEDGVGDACGGPPTLAVTDVQASKVFQFKDGSGVVSFSDQAPVTTRSRDVSQKYRKREQYFRVKLVLDQAPAGIRMQTRIMADTQQIFLFLSRHLKVDSLRQVFLDLRLLPDRNTFAAYRRRVAPGLKTNSGFYSSSRNEAVVRMRHADELTLEVVRHETSHLIAAALFGNLPKWLNEGLAEYFERMEVDGLAKTITPSRYFLKVLRKHQRGGTLPQLPQHLRLSRRQWLREDEKLRYAVGWSIVYHLMATPRGRRFLAALLKAQAAHRCQRFSTANFVDSNYPAGIEGLDRDWRQWLAGRDPVAQYF